MKLLSKGKKYIIAYDEEDGNGVTGFYFYGNAKGGAIYGAMQLVLAEGLDVTGDEPLDEPIPDDVAFAARRILSRYRSEGVI